ncbi:MAG: FecR domain-containing protein [Acinetobacter populi]|jgi:transmembrane sensor|uniref:FecR family protein n=1 Tax=Acinetobacter populi TaxID=1582270 RepID=UPI002355A0F5|nr:FecR domain-containing protein [Acinetobacter populi]MCH4246407.1 FecR domain-containing protein [Acinetobacter populi]
MDKPYTTQEKQQAYEQAAEWFMLMQEHPLNTQQQVEFEAWLAAKPLHQEVWQNVAMFEEKFNRMPKQVIAKTVQELKPKKKNIGKLSMAFISLLTAFYAFQGIRQQDYFPELLSFDAVDIYKTKIGEQQQVALQDGSQIWLNSQTKIRVKYNNQQRKIELANGEIYIETHKDPLQRPFSVYTQHGDLVALGTKFNVDYTPHQTELSVQEGAVRIQTKNSKRQQIISAQHAALFDTDKIYPQAFHAGDLLWRQHLLVVHSMPLSQFIKELSKYDKTRIILDPSAHNVLVSGSYSTQDIRKTLEIIAHTYQLNISGTTDQIRITANVSK